jgi:hypothetical protein
LHRRQAEVKQYAVYRKKVVFNADGLQIYKIIINEESRLLILVESLTGDFQCKRVGIDAQQLAAGGAVVQNGRGMSAATECTINISAARLDGKSF